MFGFGFGSLGGWVFGLWRGWGTKVSWERAAAAKLHLEAMLQTLKTAKGLYGVRYSSTRKANTQEGGLQNQAPSAMGGWGLTIWSHVWTHGHFNAPPPPTESSHI